MADNHRIQWFSSTNEKLEFGTNDCTAFATKVTSQVEVPTSTSLSIQNTYTNSFMRSELILLYIECRGSVGYWLLDTFEPKQSGQQGNIHFEIVIMPWNVVGLRLTHLLWNLFCLLMKLALKTTLPPPTHTHTIALSCVGWNRVKRKVKRRHQSVCAWKFIVYWVDHRRHKMLTDRDLVRRTTEKSFKVFRKMDRNRRDFIVFGFARLAFNYKYKTW